MQLLQLVGGRAAATWVFWCHGHCRRCCAVCFESLLDILHKRNSARLSLVESCNVQLPRIHLTLISMSQITCTTTLRSSSCPALFLGRNLAFHCAVFVMTPQTRVLVPDPCTLPRLLGKRGVSYSVSPSQQSWCSEQSLVNSSSAQSALCKHSLSCSRQCNLPKSTRHEHVVMDVYLRPDDSCKVGPSLQHV